MGLDFRKELRAIANRVQDENARRLLAGSAVSGSPFADRRDESSSGPETRARARVFGVRISIRKIQRLGVATGAMLKDATRRSNVKLGRTSFRIVPSPEIRPRWFAFNAGRPTQAARPFSGVSDDVLSDAAAELARAGRDQICAAINRRVR